MFILAAALQGCSTLTPTAGEAIDRMIDDCVRAGSSEDECQQRRGCEPGMTRSECRRILKRSIGIWTKD